MRRLTATNHADCVTRHEFIVTPPITLPGNFPTQYQFLRRRMNCSISPVRRRQPAVPAFAETLVCLGNLPLRQVPPT